MDEAQRQFFSLVPPRQSSTPGLGITWLATSVVAAAHDLSINREFFHKEIVLIASGGKIWLSTSADGTTPIDKGLAASATIAAGTSAPRPIPLGDGIAITMRFDTRASKFLHVQADAGTPTLIIFPASSLPSSDQQGGG